MSKGHAIDLRARWRLVLGKSRGVPDPELVTEHLTLGKSNSLLAQLPFFNKMGKSRAASLLPETGIILLCSGSFVTKCLPIQPILIFYFYLFFLTYI